MSTVFALVAAYFGVLFAISLLVRPKRERLVALAHQLLSEDPSPKHAAMIHRILDSAYRIRSAPLQTLGLIIVLFTPAARFDRDAHEWGRKNAEIICDPRWAELGECHTASIFAANPIFGALVYLGLALVHVKAWIYFRQQLRNKVPTQYATFERKAADAFGRLKVAA